MPLCLPSKSLEPDTFVGERPTLVGWGSIDYDGKITLLFEFYVKGKTDFNITI